MSRKQKCFDHAMVESFFGTLKAEYFHLENYDGNAALVNDYISYYKHEHIKLEFQGLSSLIHRVGNTA